MRLKGIFLTACIFGFKYFPTFPGPWLRRGLSKGLLLSWQLVACQRNESYVCHLECSRDISSSSANLNCFGHLLVASRLMSLQPLRLQRALVYPDIATLVTALLRKRVKVMSSRVIPFAPCRRLPSTVMPSHFGRLGGFIHSKFLPRLLQMSLKSSRSKSLLTLPYRPINILLVEASCQYFLWWIDKSFPSTMNFNPIVFVLYWYLRGKLCSECIAISCSLASDATNGSSIILSSSYSSMFHANRCVGSYHA